MKTFIEFLQEVSSTIGKSGSGHNKGFGDKDNTFGDKRGGARKPNSPILSDLKAGLKVPRLALMVGKPKVMKFNNQLGKVGEPKIKYSKPPSEMRG